ncbi:uncharacterized protein AB675_4716 [Cyphellophora attinorum]|uniref:Uncharacterized protein n=1 Tax=Cyphellophora attinorum TaxID=1664694 RepID=A0A0N1HNL3_9EURO|nr:uncharacterized protein AB675_4716 [Phialophora attinorum]KPI39143.1 hypothetical protein AB675_4716 [Phialophora attinorum]
MATRSPTTSIPEDSQDPADAPKEASDPDHLSTYDKIKSAVPAPQLTLKVFLISTLCAYLFIPPTTELYHVILVLIGGMLATLSLTFLAEIYARSVRDDEEAAQKDLEAQRHNAELLDRADRACWQCWRRIKPSEGRYRMYTPS